MGLDNPIHIAFLLMVLLLIFGAKRLPEMGRSLGDGLRGFKEAINGQAPVAQASQVAPMVSAAPEAPLAPQTEQAQAQAATPAEPAPVA